MIANTVVESCESTNDLVRMLGEAGYPHGTWVSAREQTRGRGRLGRTWQSTHGNLFLSLLARVQPRDLWTWIPLAAAAAIAQEFSGEAVVTIKWPNDLWLGRAKLGGILCEAVGSRIDSFVIIGVGLNCAVAPEGLDQPTARLNQPVDEVRARVLRAILAGMDELSSRGTTPLREHYGRLAALKPGTRIEWGTEGEGDVVGLGDSGELIVTDGPGRTKRLFAEDVKIRLSRKEDGESPA